MHTDLDVIARQLLAGGYTTMPFQLLPERRERLLKGFDKFCQDRTIHGGEWGLPLLDLDDPDSGVLPRRGATRTTTGDEGQYDDKTVLHLHQHTLRRLEEERGLDLSAHADFMQLAGNLYEQWSSAQYQFVLALQKEFEKLYQQRCGRKPLSEREETRWKHLRNLSGLFYAADGLHVLRFIAYHETRPDSVGLLGEQHLDRAALTTRILETAPGLKFGFNGFMRDAFQEYPLREGEIAIFAGMKLEELTAHQLRALYHLIEEGEYEPYSETIKRIAIVGFGHVPSDVAYMRAH